MHTLLICFLLFCVSPQNITALIQEFCWRDYIPGYLPIDALEAAKGRYIGQVYEIGFVPGTIFPYTNTAIVEVGGRKIHTINIKILCTNYPERFYWEQVNFNNPAGNQMDNAVKGGYQGNDPLYIGKVFNEGEWKIGKVVLPVTALKGLWIWTSAGGSNRLMEFQLLKYNYTIVAEDGSVLYAK